jgi:DNA-binding transcriptional LysR family regulator
MTAIEPSAQVSGATGSPLASSAAFGVFAMVFAIAAPVIYVASEIGGFPLFTYHPGTGRIDFGFAAARPNEGPAMYWYGWLATTLIGAALAGLFAAFLPRSLTARAPLFLIWLLPLLALPILAYALMPFWTR